MAKHSIKKRGHYPPGSLIYRGREVTSPASAKILHYNPEGLIDLKFTGSPEVFASKPGHTTWIHVSGIHDVDLISSIGKIFQLHPLLLEDVISTETPPKQEDFENCMFASLNGITFNEEEQRLTTTNVSLVLLKDVIISFQESGHDFSAIIYERLVNNKGMIRTRKADYLFYRMIDVIVDEYKTILDVIEDHTEVLEERSIRADGNSSAAEIHRLRRQLNRMKRNVMPLKVAINRLYLEPAGYFLDQTMHFLRDLLDDILHLEQRIESARENLLNIMDINYTNLSIKTNEVMQMLTIVATMFIPMTFIAGVYGMNFEFIPELGWKHSYATFWALMLLLVAGMLFYFRKRKWL